MTLEDLKAIRARAHGKIRTCYASARADRVALLAYVDELEARLSREMGIYGIPEPHLYNEADVTPIHWEPGVGWVVGPVPKRGEKP